jgi:hypothetical protein
MLVISPTEFKKTPVKYCEMATSNNVFVQYADSYIKLTLVKRLPRKPKNPNNPSPSGDTWFDNPRNLTIVEEGIKNLGKKQGTLIKGERALERFLDSL